MMMGAPQAPMAMPMQGSYQPNTNNYGYTDYAAGVGPSQPQQQQPMGFHQPQQQQQQPLPAQMGAPQLPGQFAMFQQPIVQDMALQYGQRLADQGKEQLEKYIPITRLKYYFAVDNKYVINKIRLLFFPFTHRDWSLKYDQDNPVQPRYDINAPDLYIPLMAYITYVVLAGLVLGMQDRFSPEQLGIQASSALAYAIMELIVYSLTLYIGNIQTMLKTLDLVAFAGYKFVIINACLVVSILFRSSGYYLCLLYASITLAFFLVSTIDNNCDNELHTRCTQLIVKLCACSCVRSKRRCWPNQPKHRRPPPATTCTASRRLGAASSTTIGPATSDVSTSCCSSPVCSPYSPSSCPTTSYRPRRLPNTYHHTILTVCTPVTVIRCTAIHSKMKTQRISFYLILIVQGLIWVVGN